MREFDKANLTGPGTQSLAQKLKEDFMQKDIALAQSKEEISRLKNVISGKSSSHILSGES